VKQKRFLGIHSMTKHHSRSQGFVLIAALLLLFLLSGIAVGVMMLTNSEIRIGGNDKEGTMAYYGAESGMEKLTSDLAALYTAKQAPSAVDIQSLTNAPPSNAMVGPITYAETITFPVDALGNPAQPTSQIISSGPNQGLTALILPMTLNVNALRPSNAAANITRRVEVALIPVFQFGMFSSSDLNFSNGAVFTFGGRVHTNGNLFLTPQAGGTTLFGDKITVVGEVLRDPMENSYPPGSAYNGSVYMPNATGGCANAIAGLRAPYASETNCLSFNTSSASWLGGMPTGAGSANGSWISTSTVSFNGFVGNPRSTGVKALVLPLVQGGGSQIDIIRRPLPNEAVTSAVGTSRLYNKANMRVLLADTLANLHPERGAGALDAEDVNITSTGTAAPVFGGDAVAYATHAADAAWVAPISAGVATNSFPLITGWLRVEYKDTNEVWHGVTNEWLAQGIGRSVSAVASANPTAATGPNPNAILVFQELASNASGNPIVGRTAIGTGTNWYPINFYDTREGQVREVNATNTNCTVNGIMNAVELDVANLTKWIKGVTGANGPSVEFTDQNGYLLYFSDRRGMLPNPRANLSDNSPANILTGEYGFEDVINNPASTTGLPNGVDGGAAEPGEDVNSSGVLDTWGAANVGDGFRVLTTAAGYPYVNVDCLNQGRMNRVTGARHVLRLIDGAVGNLPLSNKGGGFTVAAENPVYIFGDYNAGKGQGVADAPIVHSPAAILADAVTMLSNSWNDINDMTNPSNAWNRSGSTTYYRTAVAGGKNIAFANTTGANNQSFGSDGGVHNFLRYVEDWGTSGSTLWYSGSMVSLYPSQYATGVYKFGATAVYNAPNRKYSFDTLFLNPANLPPGTPMFQDVVNLSYRQDFTPY
jgi:PilX N-terminal